MYRVETIRKVGKAEYNQVVEFVMRLRKEIFPMLNHDQLPLDLLHFDQYYLDTEKSAFFAAFSEDGSVLGTIGVLPYDGRFEKLEHDDSAQTAEIIKCYIDPNYRRLGIGTELVKEATRFSRHVGYRMNYLHTHPFLPGAVPFWEAQGYGIRLVETHSVWKTIHMDRQL